MSTLSPVSPDNALHYSWGDRCDGWHLVRTAELSVIYERMPARTAETRHSHSQSRQFFFVLEGSLVIAVGAATLRIDRRQGIEIAPGVEHQVLNVGPSEAHLLVISQPPSHGDRVPAQEYGRLDTNDRDESSARVTAKN